MSAPAVALEAGVSRAPGPRTPDPQTEPAPRPRLRLASPPRRSVRLLALGGILVVVASLFALVAMHVLLAQGEFQLEQVRSEREAEQRRYETLRLEVARLVAPERIIESAAELGLVEPDAVRYLEAPSVAVTEDVGEVTRSTLEQTWSDAKVSLGATG